MEKTKTKSITLSDVGFGNKIMINGHVYTYQGQDKRKANGGTKTMYIFKMVTTKNIPQEFWEKTFDITASLRIKKIANGKDDEVKFEIY